VKITIITESTEETNIKETIEKLMAKGYINSVESFIRVAG